jgi:nucleotide-binding universal stress UspA family protein
MLKKNRIIVLIDFSKYTDILLKSTQLFAEILKADILFVHQVAGVMPAMANAESREKLGEIEKQEALMKLNMIVDDTLYTRATFQVSDKNILTILEELADEDYFDWVFAGVKGAGILRQIFIGSTTLNVIDNTQLLTVAIPLKKDIIIPKKLIIAANYKFPFQYEQLRYVLDALSGTVEEIEFITVVKEENETSYQAYLDEVLELFKTYHPSSRTFISDDPFSEIRHYILHRKDTYLVVQQGSRSFVDTLFRKFMINELVYAGSIPLIVISE